LWSDLGIFAFSSKKYLPLPRRYRDSYFKDLPLPRRTAIVISKIYRCRAAPRRLCQKTYRYRAVTATAIAARQRLRRHGHLCLNVN
jgi:hypothetical protein